MNKVNINGIALAVSLAFSAGTMAQTMSKDDYRSGKDRISADYKSDKAGCASLAANAGDICVAQAKGNEQISRAELEANYKPTVKNRYEARVAVAQADYAVAKERCDDLAGNPKDLCVKEAKAVQTAAEADAKAQMKTSDANATANEKSSEARQDAAASKLDAQYTVEKEKCNTFAGNAKDNCLAQAKARFGK